MMPPPHIVGTWKLITWRQPDNNPEHPFGPTPVGYLIYHPGSNRVAFQVMKAGRPRVSVANDSYLRMSSADQAAVAEGFFGYTGQSAWQDDIVTHNIEIAFNPSLVGQQQAYRYHLAEDILTLSALNGNLQTTWKRAKPIESSSQILPPSQLVGIWKLVSMYMPLKGFLSRLMWIMADRATPLATQLKGKPIIYPHGQNARGYLIPNVQLFYRELGQ
ncbi:MAG: lipocalin-like domain-containing protein [Anaerolineae bacterium]|nr:lipocalin-like domain-containing protein [Anaerolineae bacterium]